ncbi:transporter [Fulvivirga sp. 29W222]|uniref:Transporter n=1 Tax=Fulvivirga marina TaxID=2494733 RepID=A0A937KGH3_9BACT|nr:transporter [Fulvivirga marina]MBL6449193.1 transporter [Fulvivirga marina]
MKHFFTILFLIASYPTFSQETIFTDRPTTTDAVKLISPGTFQIEMGYMNTMYDAVGIDFKSITSPNLSIKYGLAEWLELRLLANYLTLKVDAYNIENSLSGVAPLVLSPKLKLIDQNSWIPRISLATAISFPEPAKEEFQTDKINYGGRLLLEHVFNDRYSWSHGFGADWDDSRETTWAYSSAFSASISDKFGAFTEIFGYFATGFPSTHSIDAGLTYLLSSNLQLDTSVGLPLNDNAPDFFYSMGIAWNTNFKK